MLNKVSILFTTDLRDKKDREKLKQMLMSFIKKEDVIKFEERPYLIYIETKTHTIRIIGMSQSPRGYRANFFIDTSGIEEASWSAKAKSTYDWTFRSDYHPVKDLLNQNGWEL